MAMVFAGKLNLVECSLSFLRGPLLGLRAGAGMFGLEPAELLLLLRLVRLDLLCGLGAGVFYPLCAVGTGYMYIYISFILFCLFLLHYCSLVCARVFSGSSSVVGVDGERRGGRGEIKVRRVVVGLLVCWLCGGYLPFWTISWALRSAYIQFHIAFVRRKTILVYSLSPSPSSSSCFFFSSSLSLSLLFYFALPQTNQITPTTNTKTKARKGKESSSREGPEEKRTSSKVWIPDEACADYVYSK